MSLGDFARLLETHERRLKALERANRTPQLAYSSVDDGSLGFTQDGKDRGGIGTQFDGATGLLVTSGPTPPTPSAPTVEQVIGAVQVTWDGTFTDSDFAPTDFSRVEVHASTDPDFPADEFRTMRTTIESPRGGEITAFVTQNTTWYFRLVARSLPGKASAYGPTSEPIQPGKVDTADLDIDYSRLSGTTIFYGYPDAPPAQPKGGDLWYVEINPGPPQEYEVRRFVNSQWVALADQGIQDAVRAAAQAQIDADAAAVAAYESGQVALSVQGTAESALDQANTARDQAATAAGRAQDAVTAANRPRVFRQADPPSNPGGPAVWYETDRDNLMYVWTGTAWDPVRIGSGAIAPQSLIAKDVIATGTITAGLLETLMVLTTTIVVGDVAGPHIEIGNREGSPYKGIALFREGGQPTFVADTATGDVFGAGTFRSEDYVEAETGWQIDREGGAEFANVNVPGTVGAGVGNFEELLVGGEPIQNLIPAPVDAPLGMIGGGSFANTIENIGAFNGEYIHGIARYRARLVQGRVYKVTWTEGRCFVNANVQALFRINYAVDAYPVSGSPVLRYHYVPSAPHTRNVGVVMERWFTADRTGTWYFGVMAQAGGGTMSVLGGAQFNQFSIEDMGSKSDFDTYAVQYGSAVVPDEPDAPAPPDPTPQPPPAKVQYDDTFNVAWARSWNQDGSVINDVDLYQGRTPYYTAGGNRRSMFGFDSAHIRSRLGGSAEIVACRLIMRNKHTHANSGGTAVVGTHNVASRPGSFSGSIDGIRKAHAKGATFEIDLGTGTGRAFRDQTVKGLTMIGPNNDAAWYAYYYGNGKYGPRLRLIYRK